MLDAFLQNLALVNQKNKVDSLLGNYPKLDPQFVRKVSQNFLEILQAQKMETWHKLPLLPQSQQPGTSQMKAGKKRQLSSGQNRSTKYAHNSANGFYEVTSEARQYLAKIKNRLGPYVCKLCDRLHTDAFELAQHQCPKILQTEYKCTECSKIFYCPGNLASHQRWHKSWDETGSSAKQPEEKHVRTNCFLVRNLLVAEDTEQGFSCDRCHKTFAQAEQHEAHLLEHLFKI
ncbi:hypothetical protein Ciccas_007480 [Cichlidogyrus casuarinus]|uniref:C2H2-type domain-containing protein n=1 Tax=Cichlidogyrus casuarinus TaxID=1844966 RepID=A0ABD2Q2S1_9PLAT